MYDNERPEDSLAANWLLAIIVTKIQYEADIIMVRIGHAKPDRKKAIRAAARSRQMEPLLPNTQQRA